MLYTSFSAYTNSLKLRRSRSLACNSASILTSDMTNYHFWIHWRQEVSRHHIKQCNTFQNHTFYFEICSVSCYRVDLSNPAGALCIQSQCSDTMLLMEIKIWQDGTLMIPGGMQIDTGCIKEKYNMNKKQRNQEFKIQEFKYIQNKYKYHLII